MNFQWLSVIVYISALFFTAMIIIKVIRYARMPVHLRWELYPVVQETRRRYGGSYFEELDFCNKIRHRSIFEELKYMGREIFFFSLYYRMNRKYWYCVYPFHIGIFLMVIWLLLLILGAVLLIASLPVSALSPNVWGILIYYFTIITGSIGLILAIYGSVSLIVKRAKDDDLKLYTARIDYFNLSIILVILLSVLGGWLLYDLSFSHFREITKNIIIINSNNDINLFYVIAIILTCILLLYMPFTRMMHFVAKYFTYHKIRWDDEPSLKGSKIEKQVMKMLNRVVTWSAPHITSGKSWAEQVDDLDSIKRK